MVDAVPRASDEVGSSTTPVIVDLGKKTKKAINNLKRGTGATRLEVEAAIRQIRLRLSDADKNKTIIPVVLIYERKRKSRRYDDDVPLFPLSSLLPFSPFR